MDREKKLRKGLLLGILVGIAWGLDGVLMGRLGLNSIFTDSAYAFSKGISEKSFLYSPLVTAFFHESFCFLWVAVVLLYHKQLKQVFQLLFNNKKRESNSNCGVWLVSDRNECISVGYQVCNCTICFQYFCNLSGRWCDIVLSDSERTFIP